MDKRAEYLIQVFEKIGTPLVSSIVKNHAEEDAQAHAQKLAELLTKSVKLGIGMTSIADLGQIEGDSARVAMSAVASHLLADLYNHSKKMPDDAEMDKIMAGLRSVLTFSENFTPEKDNTGRLRQLEGAEAGFDDVQMSIHYMYIFVPVIDAVARYAFGQPEQKLVMSVAIRLTAEATNLRKSLIGSDLSEIDAKRTDGAVLRALVALYTACHLAETEKIKASGGEPDKQNPVAPVWAAYEMRVAILESLAKTLSGEVVGGGGDVQPEQGDEAAASPAVAPESEPAPVSAPQEALEASSVPAPEPSAAPPEAPKASAPSTGANPMAMFSKKPQASAPSEPQETPSPEKQQEQPQEQPTASSPEPKQESPDDSDSSSDSGSQSGGAQGGGSSPMSFFKKGGD